ncbi:EAL domain-containing protein [Labrys wisconsinensis]|uniref:Diguanylate cyclase (GGDEF)-like protein/PAS domain S-box-containing protein n=1 Tax=Labrys wisconsinensis TaxID=425677 RepID=A0ABU0J7Z4_9HYPH|nr:EAL domain-containing protein [Labrys wisconsinensis]MDQ0470394.1 diguanylate cyclase (GGDEF)-like protein/PAS domain S-box-containing protein [Labrys wisconsinensis]
MSFKTVIAAVTAFLVCVLAAVAPASALEPVSVTNDVDAIDLSPAVQFYSTQGDRIQIQTAPGPDGIVRRIEVRAKEAGANPNWIGFALANTTDEQIDRILVAPHFRLVGSGLVWPDLGASRIADITPSQGFRPEREDANDADVFRITLDPGSRITFVAELRTAKLPQLYLWDPDAYKDKINSLTLYKGIVMGIAGLLALFLTIAFVVKGTAMFPAAAALAWAVLAYLAIDFGFLHKILAIQADGDRTWRAGAEAIFSATLLVFLFAYLNLNRWHVRYSYVLAAWLVALCALVGLAVVDAPVAAGVARISIATLAAVGLLIIIYLAAYGYDRAVMLIPTWTLLLAWVVAAGMTITGHLTNDLVQPALTGGLVLVVMLIGFTVMQHAFAGGAFAPGLMSDTERKALALTGSGDIVWDWDVPADKIYVSPEADQLLAVKRGTLDGPASRWLELVHVLDRDRFRTALDAVIDQRRGRVSQDFRIRSGDGHYRWLSLKARPVVGSDGEVVRCVGVIADVTEQKTAQERLLHDAVHDNLTGLPNRELFMDRLEAALAFARQAPEARPALILLDIDRYKKINDSVGLAVGDSILLTVARRLSRLLKPRDSVARISGDQFGLIVMSEHDPAQISAFAETIRRTLRTPVAVADREIFLTASIGVVLIDGEGGIRAEEALKDAEIAMYHAKKHGGDRIEVFRPAMRSDQPDRLALEADLRRAIERDEIKVLYQPIVRLEDRTIAGFEALVRWDHPRLGRMSPRDFIPVAEDSGLIVDLGLSVLDKTTRQLVTWQRLVESDPPIFASVNVSSRQLLRHDLIHDLKGVLSRSAVAPGSLKLEITESLVMENPEYAAQMLIQVRDLGAGLSMDDFGTGYSSLAYLQRFPFDTIKIDQSFVRQNGSGARPVILRSIIAMAHDLGMDVVAEGAETDADAAELFALGCEYAQGYAFGEPMTAEEARRLIAGPVRLRA